MKEELQIMGFGDDNIWFFYEEGYDSGKKYLYPIDEFPYLEYLEMYVTNNCNFACKNCAAFAPLVKEKTMYEFEKFKKDLLRCKELFPFIKKFRFLGGEPLLLGDDLCEYIDLVRKIYPYTDIRITSNGALIKKISEKLINTINENRITVDITVYPVMYSAIDDIVKYASQKSIKLYLSNRVGFCAVLNAEQKEFPFNNVKGCHCTTIENGYIAKCPLIFHVKYYNEAFNTRIPDDCGKINLYDDVNGVDIIKAMEVPFELCNYCNIYKVWHHSDKLESCQQLNKNKMKKEDWY